ncbi:site-specific tyrosine recombinase XerD [bacterium CPR1]|nr:site-specific tyrosine recombinase XerD [bacterium CPR1]
MSSTLDPVLWEERFRDHLEVRGRSADTVTTYLMGVRPFLRFLEERGVASLGAVTRELVETYRTELFYLRYRGRPLSLSTQQARLAGVKAFFRFLARRGFVLVDVASGLELPRCKAGLPTVLTEAEMQRLLDVPDPATLLGVRDRTLLEVLYGTGIRNGELCALTLDACDLAVPALRILRGKGGKSRVVPLGEEALAWLEAYLGQVRPRLLRSAGEKAVFLSKDGRPLARPTLIDVVARLARKATLQKKITPHVLRHSMATHMLRRGAGLRQLQVLLGHSSSAVTEHYTRVEIADLRRVLRRCHPRERRLRA